MTKYSPITSHDSDVKKRSFQSRSIRSFVPGLLHLSMLAMVNFFILYINNHQFVLKRGPIEVVEVDGTVARLPQISLAQSDITTLISFLSSFSRVIGTLWAVEVAWRCIFLFLEDGGMPLSGIERILRGGIPPARRNFRATSHFVLFLAILVVIFLSDYFSSVLTGSITWYSTFTPIPGTRPLRDIPRVVPGDSFRNYSSAPGLMDLVISSASASATVAWGLNANDTTMKRVLKRSQLLTVNSKLRNVTVPYFVVTKFEWIKDPTTLSEQQNDAVHAAYEPRGPYFSSKGKIGLLPDGDWTSLNDSVIPNPHSVIETRILSIRTATSMATCNNDDPSIPADIQRLTIPASTGVDCFAFANVSYQAGAAKCENCTISARTVVNSISVGLLQLLPHPMTKAAVAHTSLMSTYLLFNYYAVPSAAVFSDTKSRSIELLSRSYQAAWISLIDEFGGAKDSTDVEIAFNTTQAMIVKWRILLWDILHALLFGLGMFVMIRQYWSDHSWAVENPPFAALMLDATELRGDGQWHEPDFNFKTSGQQTMITLDSTSWRIKSN